MTAGLCNPVLPQFPRTATATHCLANERYMWAGAGCTRCCPQGALIIYWLAAVALALRMPLDRAEARAWAAC